MDFEELARRICNKISWEVDNITEIQLFEIKRIIVQFLEEELEDYD